MMSAKTVLTDTPVATPVPASPNNAASPATAAGTPSDFQNLLAGAVTPGVEVPVLAPGTQPLLDLIKLKNAQQSAMLAGANAGAAQTAKAAKPTVAPTDLLKILNDSAALLPSSTDGEA